MECGHDWRIGLVQGGTCNLVCMLMGTGLLLDSGTPEMTVGNAALGMAPRLHAG